MSKKYIESDLYELCEDVIDTLGKIEYKKLMLTTIKLVLNRKISAKDVEWDMLAEREKFEPADTN